MASSDGRKRQIITTLMKILLPVALLAIGVSTFVHLKSSGPQPPKSEKRERARPVRVEPVVVGRHQPRLRLFGETAAGRKVELRALVGGKVIEAGPALGEGAQIGKGELLLRVDPFEYQGAIIAAKAGIAAAKARLKEIEASEGAERDGIAYAEEQLHLAERDLDRANKLVGRGSVTEQGADQRRLLVSQRKQALDAKRANLDVLKAKHDQEIANIRSLEWKLQEAERNLVDTELRAPFDGYLGEVNAEVGKLLNVNDRVAVLLDSDRLDAVFNLSDRQYGRLLEAGGVIGRPVEVSWHVGQTPHTYEAVIERVGAQISSQTGGVTVYARLSNPGKPYPLRAGAFVEVSVPDRTYEGVVRLPQTALYGRSKVYVVDAGGRLDERTVQLVGLDGDHVLLQGPLVEGERVVTTRFSNIGGGLKVKEIEAEGEAGTPQDNTGKLPAGASAAGSPPRG